MIPGVEIHEIKTHTDERGFFREIARFGEPVAQASHSRMRAGVVKAWHLHRRQTDWWYVASGAIKVALADVRDGPQLIETAEFLMGDDCGEARLLKIPPGVAHGCKALTDANLLYFTSHTYDPEDELRLPHDDARIGYDWLRREIR